MNLGTNLFLAYMIYFILTYIKLVTNKTERANYKKSRARLEELRSIPVKTDAEQLEFITLKNPKTPPFKWTFMNVIKALLKFASIILLFMVCRHLWKTYVPFLLPLWSVMIFVIVFPIIINKILKKYNLHQDDLSVFFGGRKK